MSDLITRKPTALMTELLRRGAADKRGIMTLADHNDRTQDGILRRDMAEVVHEDGATHSWLVINDKGRAYVAKLEAAEKGKQEAVSAPQAAEERPAAVDVMRAEAESVSAVSEAFAARVRGEERPQEPDMAAMSEEEHSAAFGERFAQVRRARMEAAQEGRAGDNLYKYDREYARLRDRRAVAEGVMDAGHAAEYAPAYSLYNRYLAGRVVAGVLATRAHWVNSNNGAAEVERMSTTEQARQYASWFKPLARVDSGPHACTLVFADGTTESLTSYDTVCLLPAPQD
ncbi:hypothetical protein ACPCSE_29310 [Streptomyces cellulosae]